jgi:drug/metabolite transporter (DMT)-like permease
VGGLHEHHVRGILAMLVGVAVFAVMDALMKLLSEHYPPFQVAFLRGAASLPVALAPVIVRRRLARLKWVNGKLHLLRGTLSIAMLGGFVQAVHSSSLAATYSIFMFAPLLVATLSAPLLGEAVARAQWIAIGIGLGGVLLMLNPFSGHWAITGALWAVLAMGTYAISVVTLRLLSRTDTTESMVFWFPAMLAVGAGALALPGWVGLRSEDALLIGALGVFGAAGQQLLTVAFRSAPAAVVAPFEYTALVWGACLDVAIWSVWPKLVTLLGGAIVIGAGLYLVAKERRSARAAMAQQA